MEFIIKSLVMKIFIILFSSLILTINMNAQFDEDAKRLSQLSYMEKAHQVDCDSMMGTNFESRICLNLEFQRVDSILNVRFQSFVDRVEQIRLQEEFIDYHKTWIEHRRLISETRSDGYRGHMLGISYLASMIASTKARIEELEHFLREY